MAEKNFKVLESNTVFAGKIMDVHRDTIQFDNGRTAIREMIAKHDMASAVAAIDPDGKLIFVQQYRYGTDQVMLEVPAGLYNKGEDGETCAVRELEEETGYKAGKTTFLFDYYATPGYCSEKITVYLCTDLVPTHQNLDPDEYITLYRYTVDEAIEMIRQGKITDGKTIAVIFAVKDRFKMD